MVKADAGLGFGNSHFWSCDQCPWPLSYKQTFLPLSQPFLQSQTLIGCAIIYGQMTANLERHDRAILAQRIAINSGVVLFIAMWAGAVVLSFCGIDMHALRIAGGLVVATQAWRILAGASQDSAGVSQGDAFFPLTIPMTTGPGTIAVAITLGSSRPETSMEAIPFVVGVTLATAALAVSIALFYGSADRLLALLGEQRARALTQFSAFLLLCIGIQILSDGIKGLHS